MAVRVIGSEFIVGTTGVELQIKPAITALADDRFVVTWNSDNGGQYDIVGRVFHADGTPAGDEFIVNAASSTDQYEPSITGLADSRFVVTWYSFEDGQYDVFGRVFNADATPAGGEFIVNTTTASDQSQPVITGLSDGRFVVTWQSFEGGQFDIRGRVYNADATPAGSDFILNSPTAMHQYEPSIAGLSDGGFVVMWQIIGSDQFDIQGRVFDADGIPAGGDFIVNTTTIGDQFSPAVTRLTDGRFVVIWESSEGGANSFDIRGRVFNADGTPARDDFIVNTTSVGTQFDPSVMALADGGFVVAWSSDESGQPDIRGRVFRADGTAADDDFILNTRTAGGQSSPSLVVLADGRLAAIWTSLEDGANSFVIRGESVSLEPAHVPPDPTGMIRGTTGRDRLVGSNGGDQILGLGGDDKLQGRKGNDLLDGGRGDDVLLGGPGADRLYGGAGNDELEGDDGNDLLDGGTGNDELKGGDGKDILLGGAGRDELSGGDHDDHLNGGTDRDEVSGGAGHDTIVAEIGDGNDEYEGNGGTDTYSLAGTTASAIVNLDTGRASSSQIGTDLLSSIENVIGGSSNDIITGNSQANALSGGAGSDTIDGRGGNDRIDGGAGDDTLIGGKNSDTFVFRAGFGNDRITDFDANRSGGQDFLELFGFGITSANIAARATIADVGGDTLVTIDGDPNHTILLSGIDNASTITVDDFRFG